LIMIGIINFQVVLRRSVTILAGLSLFLLVSGQTVTSLEQIHEMEEKLNGSPPDQKIRLMNEIASAYLTINPEKSLIYADFALEMATTLNNTTEESKALYLKGKASFILFKYDEAIESFNNALKIVSVSGSDTLLSNLMFSLGEVYFRLNDYPEASKLLLSSCDIEEKLNHQLRLADRYSLLAKIYQAMGDYPAAIIYFNRAVLYEEANDNKQKMADLYNNIGILYSDLGNFNKTLEYYLKSLRLVEELNNNQGIAKTLNNIGIIYYEWGNKEKALEYYQKSLKIEESLKNNHGIADSYNNIGIIYSDWNQNELAIDYYNRAQEYYEEFSDDSGSAKALNNIGESYHAMGNHEKALEYLNKSLEIEKSLSNKHGIAESYHSIATVYFKINDIAKAEHYNSASFKIADSLKLTSVLLLNYDLFYQIYSAKKDYARALQYFRNYSLQKDTIYNRQFHHNLAELQAKYEIDRLDKEREIANSNNENKAKEIKVQRIYLIIIFILMLIFGILVYFDVKSRIKANKQLKKINQEIIGQKEELTLANDELRKSEAKYRNLVEHSPTGIIHITTEGKILEFNKKILEILGSHDAESIKEINCLDYPPLQKIGLSDAVIKAMETRKMVFNEASYSSKWGKKIHVRFYVTPILNLQDKVTNLIINVEDVSLFKEFERSKIKSELKYRILVENSLQAMLIISYKKLIFANARMKELSKYDFRELASQEDWLKLIIHPDDYLMVSANIKDALDKKKVAARNEYRYIRKDGVTRWMESLGSIVEYEGQAALLIVAIDITERKEAESILIESEGELKKANAMKDKFFSIIAHDLKNPFNAILGFSNLLYEAYDNFDDHQRKSFIKNICTASGSTFKLLQNLLEWSRTQSGKMEINPENVDIKKAFHENLLVLRSAADNKNLMINSSIPANTFVFADNNMVKAILRNLVSNAIKFTDSGGVIDISVINNERDVEVCVADTGVGINADDLSKLFRIDTHFKTKGTQDEDGSGLGLILCKEFVEKNAGKIWAISEPGVGSKFIFTLPKGYQS
jgi:PAS domain S-box-containing protein